MLTLLAKSHDLRCILIAGFAASTARAALDVVVPLYAKNGAILITVWMHD